MTRTHPAACLALISALLMLAGLLAGAAIPVTPYPRLMLSAHDAGFTSSGVISMFAGLLLFSSLCTVSQRGESGKSSEGIAHSQAEVSREHIDTDTCGHMG